MFIQSLNYTQKQLGKYWGNIFIYIESNPFKGLTTATAITSRHNPLIDFSVFFKLFPVSRRLPSSNWGEDSKRSPGNSVHFLQTIAAEFA